VTYAELKELAAVKEFQKALPTCEISDYRADLAYSQSPFAGKPVAQNGIERSILHGKRFCGAVSD